MKELVLKINNYIGIKSARTKNIIKHIGWSMFYQTGSIITNFMLVPLTINYLDTENFGVWLTLSSFISWFAFFDIGIGNGLRNKFAESRANGDLESAKGFVSTAYFTIGAISVFLVVTFLIASHFIDWAKVFNTKTTLRSELSLLLPIVFTFFGIQLVSNFITTIYQADQHHSIQNKIQFVGQLISLLVIWILTKTNGSSLLIFGGIFSALPVLILVGLNLFAFKTTYKEFKPKISYFRKEYLNEITGLGFKFFVVQIAVIVLYSTDNFVISQLFGPEEVVPYNVALKYFSVVTLAFGILIAPFWSSFTEAYSKKDFKWIKNAVKNIQKIWIAIPFILGGMLLVSSWFYELWVGDKVVLPLHLSMAIALFVLLTTFNMVYVNFINGVGKIKLQVFTAIISMVLNIPLSIYFGKYLEWGTTGVILATCFCSVYSIILKPMQYYKIINNKAKGIWNK